MDGPYFNHKNNMDDVHKGKFVRAKTHVQYFGNGNRYSFIKTKGRRPSPKNPWL